MYIYITKISTRKLQDEYKDVKYSKHGIQCNKLLKNKIHDQNSYACQLNSQ